LKAEYPKLKYLNTQGVPQYEQKQLPQILDKDAKHNLLPGSDLWMWAHGVAQMTLDSVPRALHDYAAIVEGWNDDAFISMYITAMQSQIEYPQKPSWIITGNVPTDLPAIIAQRNRIRQWIKIYCNSRKHLERGRIIITADTSPFLTNALCFRSQSDCAGINIADWERRSLVPEPPAMTGDTDYHRLITSTMQQIHAHLTQNRTILRWCGVWRLCRVNPGQFNLGASELANGKYKDLWTNETPPSEDYLRDHIRPADLATGYLQ